MPEYNVDRIRQLMGEVNAALHKLRKHAELKEKDFLAIEDKIDSAKYNMIVAIEGTIDICNHIVAQAGGRAPNDHADCFVVLGELKILNLDFVERLRQMARFRNLLVHLYWKVDDKKVFQILSEDIQDIQDYLNSVEKIITTGL